jgi:pimeloyl-ACP methyl ester carboxylesterase
VDVDSRRIAFRRTGQGPILLLLHGAVCDSRAWRVELDTFGDAFDVVAWDAPGCGGSTDPPESWRMAEFAGCAAGFLQALGVGPALVVGHSWGSTLALELALQHPDRVRALVLVGAYAGWAGSLPPEDLQRRLDFALAAADRPDAFDPRSMPGLFSDAMDPGRAAELEAMMSEIRPAGTRTMALALAEADLRPRLGEIGAPTLLVAGSVDERSPLPVAEVLHRSIPGSTLVVLPGLGHECYLESPVAFEAAVRPFLDLYR